MHGTRPELNSWKEIADRLDVSVRTAQLWEKERGLPVRRVPGPRGRVFIRVAELEEWLHSTGVPSLLERPTSSPVPPGRGVLSRVGLASSLLAGLAVVAALSAVGALVFPWPGTRIDRVEFAKENDIGADTFVALYEDPVTLVRTLQFDNIVESALVSSGEDRTQVVFVGFGLGPVEHRGYVAAFDTFGDERWKFDLYDRAVLDEARGTQNDVSDTLTPTDLHLTEIDDRSVIAVVAHDLSFFASRVTLLDAELGEHLGTYWHDGALGYGLSILGDLEGDGDAELIVSGSNNGAWGTLLPMHAPNAVVMALDLAELSTWGYSQSWPRRRWTSMPIRMPLWYHLIQPGLDEANVSELSLRDADRDGAMDVYVRTFQGGVYLIRPDGKSASAAPSTAWLVKNGAETMPADLGRVTDLDVAIAECLAGDVSSGLVHLGRAATQVSHELVVEWNERCRILAETPPMKTSFRLGHPGAGPAWVASVEPSARMARAGLRAGDVIVGVGVHDTAGGSEVLYRLHTASRANVTIELRIERGSTGRTIVLEVPAASETGVSGRNPAQ